MVEQRQCTISAASTNATLTKNAAGSVYNIQAFNNGATIGYLKFYNKASSPTVGTDTPVTTILIPANSSSLGAGAVISLPVPKNFSTGIAWALTANVADSDTTAVAANQFVINFDYN